MKPANGAATAPFVKSDGAEESDKLTVVVLLRTFLMNKPNMLAAFCWMCMSGDKDFVFLYSVAAAAPPLLARVPSKCFEDMSIESAAGRLLPACPRLLFP